MATAVLTPASVCCPQRFGIMTGTSELPEALATVNKAFPREGTTGSENDNKAERDAVFAHIAKYSRASYRLALLELLPTLFFYAVRATTFLDIFEFRQNISHACPCRCGGGACRRAMYPRPHTCGSCLRGRGVRRSFARVSAFVAPRIIRCNPAIAATSAGPRL